MSQILDIYLKAVSEKTEELLGIRTSRLLIEELFDKLERISPELADAARGDAEKKAAQMNINLKYGGTPFILSDELKNRLTVKSGIPSPEVMEDILGLPAEDCFLVSVEGDSMINAHISDGDTLVCTPTSTPESGDIIIAEFNRQMLIKRYMIIKNQAYLVPENPLYKQVRITTKDKFTTLGKVIKIIKSAE